MGTGDRGWGRMVREGVGWWQGREERAEVGQTWWKEGVGEGRNGIGTTWWDGPGLGWGLGTEDGVGWGGEGRGGVGAGT